MEEKVINLEDLRVFKEQYDLWIQQQLKNVEGKVKSVNGQTGDVTIDSAKNPYSLIVETEDETFKYDGSKEVKIVIPDMDGVVKGQDFSATATTLSPESEATVKVTNEGTKVNFAFGLPKGERGRGVKSQTITYAQSLNGTEPPSGVEDWTETIPEVQEGMYLWTRVTLQYTDNTASETFYSVSKQGIQGTAGVGINRIVTYYQWNKSLTKPSTDDSDWSSSIPTVNVDKGPVDGCYLWAKTEIYLSDDPENPHIYYTVSAPGAKGSTGSTGTGISNISISYVMSDTNVTPSASAAWTSNINNLTLYAGWYLWTKIVVSYTDINKASSTFYTVAKQGATGEGTVGMQGPQGIYISAISAQYNSSNSSGDWQDTFNSSYSSLAGYYLRFKITLKDPANANGTSTIYSSATYIKNATSLSSIKVHYAKSFDNVTPPPVYIDKGGIPVDNPDWKNSIFDLGDLVASECLWTRTTFSWNNNTQYAYSVTRVGEISATPHLDFTATVDNNVGTPKVEITENENSTNIAPSYNFKFSNLKGHQGATGNGIIDTIIEYGISTSGTDSTSVGFWGADIPQIDLGDYLWTRIKLKYSDGTEQVAYSVTTSGSGGISEEELQEVIEQTKSEVLETIRSEIGNGATSDVSVYIDEDGYLCINSSTEEAIAEYITAALNSKYGGEK